MNAVIRNLFSRFSLLFLLLGFVPAYSQDTPTTPPPASSSPQVITSPTSPSEAAAAPSAETPPVRRATEVPRVVVTDPSPPLPPDLVLPPPGGPVEEFIGHRKTDNDGSGWGWIKKPDEDWSKARWVTLRETARSPAPWRALGNKAADDNFEYNIWGYFADHQVYDPIYDELLDVFVLDHTESLGLAKPLARKPGPLQRFMSGGHAPSSGTKANHHVHDDDQAF